MVNNVQVPITHLEILLNVEGALNIKELRFQPNMVDQSIKTYTIYFPYSFKLTDELLTDAIKKTTNHKEILTSALFYTKLVKYATDPVNGYNPKETIEELLQSGNIEDNIQFMMKTWIPKNSTIIINSRAYNIMAVSLDTHLPETPTADTRRFVATFTIRVIRKENDGFVGRQRIRCRFNRDHINELYSSIFGPASTLFSRRDDDDDIDDPNRAVLNTNYTGYTTGYNQLGYNNYAYPNRYGVAPYGMPPPVPVNTPTTSYANQLRYQGFAQPTYNQPRQGFYGGGKRKKTRRRKKKKAKNKKKKKCRTCKKRR